MGAVRLVLVLWVAINLSVDLCLMTAAPHAAPATHATVAVASASIAFAQTTLLAFWTAFGFPTIAMRLLAAVPSLTVVSWLACLSIDRPSRIGFVLVAIALDYALGTLACGLPRWWFHRLSLPANQADAVPAGRVQFTLSSLLTITTVVAIALALGRHSDWSLLGALRPGVWAALFARNAVALAILVPVLWLESELRGMLLSTAAAVATTLVAAAIFLVSRQHPAHTYGLPILIFTGTFAAYVLCSAFLFRSLGLRLPRKSFRPT